MTFYNLTNITRPHDMFQMANYLTNNAFGSVVVLLCFVISLMYLATHERPFGYAFATAAYITAIITILLRVLEVVPNWVVYLTILAGIGGAAYVVLTPKEM